MAFPRGPELAHSCDHAFGGEKNRGDGWLRTFSALRQGEEGKEAIHLAGNEKNSRTEGVSNSRSRRRTKNPGRTRNRSNGLPPAVTYAAARPCFRRTRG